MRPGEAWLRRRVPATPAPLLEAMLDALPEDAPSEAEGLALAALELYTTVARGGGGREDALPLLAADALFTHAFQAQAETDPSGLPALVERWDARGRLAEVLP